MVFGLNAKIISKFHLIKLSNSSYLIVESREKKIKSILYVFKFPLVDIGISESSDSLRENLINLNLSLELCVPFSDKGFIFL